MDSQIVIQVFLLQFLLLNQLDNISKNSIIQENVVTISPGFNQQSQTVYSYDITKQFVDDYDNVLTDIDFTLRYNYTDISGEVGPYWNFDNFKNSNPIDIVWDKINSKDISFNRNDYNVSDNVITADVNLIEDDWDFSYGLSRYVIHSKPLYDISLNFKINKEDTYFQFGFGYDNINYQNIDDSFEFSMIFKPNGEIGIIEPNALVTPKQLMFTNEIDYNQPFNENDIYTILMTADDYVTCRYYKNNVELFASETETNYPLYIIYRPYNKYPEAKGIYDVKATPISPYDISKNWTGESITSLDFIDKDITLGKWYRYNINARAIPVDGEELKTKLYSATILTNTGVPTYFSYDYDTSTANLKLKFNTAVDISDNVTTIWDISWNKIQKNGQITNGVFLIGDKVDNFPDNNPGGKNYIRIIDYSGVNGDFLEPDVSYNFQIKGIYTALTRKELRIPIIWDSNNHSTPNWGGRSLFPDPVIAPNGGYISPSLPVRSIYWPSGSPDSYGNWDNYAASLQHFQKTNSTIRFKMIKYDKVAAIGLIPSTHTSANIPDVIPSPLANYTDSNDNTTTQGILYGFVFTNHIILFLVCGLHMLKF